MKFASELVKKIITPTLFFTLPFFYSPETTQAQSTSIRSSNEFNSEMYFSGGPSFYMDFGENIRDFYGFFAGLNIALVNKVNPNLAREVGLDFLMASGEDGSINGNATILSLESTLKIFSDEDKSFYFEGGATLSRISESFKENGNKIGSDSNGDLGIIVGLGFYDEGSSIGLRAKFYLDTDIKGIQLFYRYGN